MASPPPKEALKEFGKRKPAMPPVASPPVKRSGHVALLVMGTMAVGGGAFALMPRQNCQPTSPGMRIAGSGRRLRIAFVLRRQPWRFERMVVAQQFLQLIIRNIDLFRVQRNDARRIWRLRTGHFGAFFRRRLSHPHAAYLVPRTR